MESEKKAIKMFTPRKEIGLQNKHEKKRTESKLFERLHEDSLVRKKQN